MVNPYLQQVHRNLPRVLSAYETDSSSPFYGAGDRFFWAWKLIDFPNGSFQAAACGLALLHAHDMLPNEVGPESIKRRILSMFDATERITAPNGSLCEALPHESSFCVTALVAADLLTAVEAMGDALTSAQRARCIEVVRPLCAFLEEADEGHGLISNHLATATQALVLWAHVGEGQSLSRARLFLDRILQAQSSEGWFVEYDGADPGYQTWLTTALADVHRRQPNWNLREPLERSLEFLSHFMHPDGSFGGIYGSRATRFCLPGGLEMLKPEIPQAASLCARLRQSVAEHRVVSLDAADSPNLAVFFNDYCKAAVHARDEIPAGPELPCDAPPFRREFKEAGLCIDRGESHYSVVSLYKGGAHVHWSQQHGRRSDPGFVGTTVRGQLVSTQLHDADANVSFEGETLVLDSPLRRVRRASPDPFKFMVLRLLSVSVFRSRRLGDWVKQGLARYLITGRSKPCGRVVRRITLGAACRVADDLSAAGNVTPLDHAEDFVAIHMASRGYWQRSDDAS